MTENKKLYSLEENELDKVTGGEIKHGTSANVPRCLYDNVILRLNDSNGKYYCISCKREYECKQMPKKIWSIREI